MGGRGGIAVCSAVSRRSAAVADSHQKQIMTHAIIRLTEHSTSVAASAAATAAAVALRVSVRPLLLRRRRSRYDITTNPRRHLSRYLTSHSDAGRRAVTRVRFRARIESFSAVAMFPQVRVDAQFRSPTCTVYRSSGRSRNFEREGSGGRQCISLVVIYHKCTQRTARSTVIGEQFVFYTGKGGLLKKIWANRGAPPPPAPAFESATVWV